MRSDIKNPPTPLGDLILKRLAALSRTQKWLAETIGVSRSHIGDIIYGRRPLPQKRIHAFIDALELSPAEHSIFEYDVKVARWGTTRSAA